MALIKCGGSNANAHEIVQLSEVITDFTTTIDVKDTLSNWANLSASDFKGIIKQADFYVGAGHSGPFSGSCHFSCTYDNSTGIISASINKSGMLSACQYYVMYDPDNVLPS